MAGHRFAKGRAEKFIQAVGCSSVYRRSLGTDEPMVVLRSMDGGREL